jgi:hypothetical protein
VRDQAVALTGDAGLYLARGSDAETLFSARLGFQLGHFMYGLVEAALYKD